MITIKVHQDAHGYSLNGKGRVRYVPKGLAGTVVESTALRQILCKTKDEASICPARVPGDWPQRGLDKSDFDRAVARAAVEDERLMARLG